jgi:hypothetical protein
VLDNIQHCQGGLDNLYILSGLDNFKYICRGRAIFMDSAIKSLLLLLLLLTMYFGTDYKPLLILYIPCLMIASVNPINLCATLTDYVLDIVNI